MSCCVLGWMRVDKVGRVCRCGFHDGKDGTTGRVRLSIPAPEACVLPRYVGTCSESDATHVRLMEKKLAVGV